MKPALDRNEAVSLMEPLLVAADSRYRGGLPRNEVPNLLNVGERQARRVVSALIGQDVLIATSPHAPLALAFPARLAPRWMPGLIPENK